jgi:Aspartyl/Asparaginyl beta-hydroxylase
VDAQIPQMPSTSHRLTPGKVAELLESGFPLFRDEILRNYSRLGQHRFPLEGYHNGKWLAEPIRTLDGIWTQVAKAHFPTLVRYVDECLAGSRLISFSELLPGAVIKPHDGVGFGVAVKILSRRADWPYERLETYFSGIEYEVLRFHLCSFSPSSDFSVLGLRSGDRQLTWEEGKCVYFDDSRVHEAWNHTSSSRLVLIVDFLKTDLGDSD